MHAAWQDRKEAKKRLQEEPNNSSLRKAVKMACKNIWKVLRGCRAEVLLVLSP